MLADRGLRRVAGPSVIPGRKAQTPKTVQLRAPVPTNPGGPIRERGLPRVETFVATLLKTFPRESEVLLSVMGTAGNPPRGNKLDVGMKFRGEIRSSYLRERSC